MSRRIPPSRRAFAGGPLLSMIVSAAALAGGTNAAAGTPDLAVLSVEPPWDLHIGVVHNATLEVWNVYDSYAGAYTVELLRPALVGVAVHPAGAQVR